MERKAWTMDRGHLHQILLGRESPGAREAHSDLVPTAGSRIFVFMGRAGLGTMRSWGGCQWYAYKCSTSDL